MTMYLVKELHTHIYTTASMAVFFLHRFLWIVFSKLNIFKTFKQSKNYNDLSAANTTGNSL